MSRDKGAVAGGWGWLLSGPGKQAESLGPTRKERASQAHARVGEGLGNVATTDIWCLTHRRSLSVNGDAAACFL